MCISRDLYSRAAARGVTFSHVDRRTSSSHAVFTSVNAKSKGLCMTFCVPRETGLARPWCRGLAARGPAARAAAASGRRARANTRRRTLTRRSPHAQTAADSSLGGGLQPLEGLGAGASPLGDQRLWNWAVVLDAVGRHLDLAAVADRAGVAEQLRGPEAAVFGGVV